MATLGDLRARAENVAGRLAEKRQTETYSATEGNIKSIRGWSVCGTREKDGFDTCHVLLSDTGTLYLYHFKATPTKDEKVKSVIEELPEDLKEPTLQIIFRRFSEFLTQAGIRV